MGVSRRPLWLHLAALLVVLGASLCASQCAEASEGPEEPYPSLLRLPDAPGAVEPVEGQCVRAVNLVQGQPLPPELVTVRADGTVVARCAATAIPVSKGLDALMWADHGRTLRRLWVLNESIARSELRWRDGRIAQLERPPGLLDRPGTQRLIGRTEGLLVAFGAAFILDRALNREP